ncbi:hypothetical protein EYC98_06800 [Halieaceae bacterium IMCC14734]|uniref:Uncharacterized protein n=1 Tax=Candidatus Litorirhabdus singularis TaxID=2518993 RepID=A0ABT3TGQ7_9GAMM|nr:hypothetical protein [Candidatus Litorirhabdus singularis]MCX2980582.1 hypothetical protein [Candidatus Litorirhabdus singularis]
MRTSSKYLAVFCFSGLLACLSLSGNAEESSPKQFGPWVWGVSGGTLYQFDSDFADGPGEFNVTRGVLQGSFGYAWDRKTSVSLSIGAGVSEYEFSQQASIGGEQPWDQIRDYRVSLPIRFAPSEKTSVIIIPSVRTYIESGASLSEGRTEGVLAGMSWKLSDSLTLGPGFGWFSEVGGGSTAFPIVVIDWKITDRISLTTGSGLAASQGPGLTLNYQLADKWTLGLTGRFEQTRFALDSDGDDGAQVGEDQSAPLLVTVEYSPWPMTSMSLLVGAEFAGQLTLEDANGDNVANSEFDTAPVIGLTFSSRF